MPVGDIRPIKAALREHYKTLRREMPPKLKAQRDRRIADRVTALWQYQRCGQLLTYVSTPIEVDTLEIIRRALAAGKRVAVPRCIPGTRDMEFFYISGLEDLSPGSFGVLEPDPENCEKWRIFQMACAWCPLCVMIGKDTGSAMGRGTMTASLPGSAGI